ncbi:hypothetical protein LTR22_026689 [Elasticomyces elasticus]|nr:hypothetical protein LTR22_026689 [Elasticomyces elasticus]KAK5736095.1 hypothetical protein LTS12_026277 [Elasticomyces elasticus]
MDLSKYEITDSKLEHSNWRFPSLIKTRPLRELDEDDFLINHKIDRSYDDSTVRFKLLVGGAVSANLEDSNNLPIRQDILKIVKEQKWVSDEYEHMWRRDGGGSAALTSHGILTSQIYHNRHPKVPRDFAILPINILVHHVEETLGYVQRLSREMTSTEKRLADGDLNLENNGDYKLLNRLNLEHIRLQRRSDFELELAANLVKYIDEYHRMWSALWEGGTSYIEDMREKIEQQKRYSEQVQRDLDLLPRRIKNQSKTISNFIIQRDNKLNISLAESNKKIAEESRRDNLLNLEMAAATAQVAEQTRQDSAAMKTIAVLTLTFLPGTAIASFFSMTMFQWPFRDDKQIASPYIYVYFVVTIPVTLLVYAFWLWWFKYSQRHYKKSHDEGLSKFEQELKMRVRSATGTW